MADPLASIHLKHAALELWPAHVRTVFYDGKTVEAAPNGDETMLDTVLHELVHHIHAQVTRNAESACLRAVADDDAKRWTPERRTEEAFAHPAGIILADAVRKLMAVYAP